MNQQLILHVPHSSTKIPNSTGYELNVVELFKEMDLLTDHYTDELFKSDKDITIQADFSRIFCDVERFEDDKKEVMSKYGMGMCYTHSSDGSLMRVVNNNLRFKILTKYYKLHHETLTQAVSAQLINHKEARIIDCHSFPNIPFNRDLNQDRDRPDICIGTDFFHTPVSWINETEIFFRSYGLTVYINKPYSGTVVPTKFINKDSRVKSMMIEINRKLYMDERDLKKTSGFIRTKRMVYDFLHMVKDFSSGGV